MAPARDIYNRASPVLDGVNRSEEAVAFVMLASCKASYLTSCEDEGGARLVACEWLSRVTWPGEGRPGAC